MAKGTGSSMSTPEYLRNEKEFSRILLEKTEQVIKQELTNLFPEISEMRDADAVFYLKIMGVSVTRVYPPSGKDFYSIIQKGKPLVNFSIQPTFVGGVDGPECEA